MITRQKYWILGLILGCSMSSHALVADGFKCAMVIQDKTSDASTRQKMEFFIARLPLSASPAPDVRLSAGISNQSLSLEKENAKLSAHLNFYYKHAIKLDSNGTPVDARQFTCIGLSATYCSKSGDRSERGRDPGDIHSCSDFAISCMDHGDPFSDENGWSRTNLVDGEPTFNEQGLARETLTSIRDKNGTEMGTVKLTCQYTGSYK